MPDPQQPELRRSEKGSATDHEQRTNQLVAEQGVNDDGTHPGPVPPAQQSPAQSSTDEQQDA